MSHHHNGGESPVQTETTVARQRSHSHHTPLNLKPVIVISNLRRRVRQKRDEKTHTLELSDTARTRTTSAKSNKESSHHQNESSGESTSARDRSQSYTLPSEPDKGQSVTENSTSNTIENDIVFESDERTPVITDGVDEDESIGKNVQWKFPRTSDTPDQSPIKLPLKLVKATKSLPETTSQSNGKKRRQTVRRTGFQLRDEDFTMIFNDLPSDEQLIIAFPCALRKDVYMHGRMFLSVNYVSFYTCFFKWEEKLTVPYTDIVSITREKSARLVPNAVKIWIKNQEQHLFVSLVPREKVFLAVFRLWQNALLEQPLDYNQLRTLVYADQQNHDETSGDSEESVSLVNHDEDALELDPPSASLPVTSTRRSELSKTSKQVAKRAVSLPPDNEVDEFPRSCTCETHRAKTYAERVFTYDVDTLFEYICGDNAFNRDFHSSQKLTDYTIGEWTVNPESGKRERLVTYKTISQSFFGTNTLTCREKQTLTIEQPHVMYVLCTEVNNEGVKFTDTFYVGTQFCMVQRDREHSSVRISGDVTFIKSVNSFIKSIIEKNSYLHMENGINEQVRRLEAQQEKPAKHKLTRKPALHSKQNAPRTASNGVPVFPKQQDSVDSPVSSSSPDRHTLTRSNILYDIGIVVGVFLILLHIFLCYKFYSVDQTLSTFDTGCFNECRKTCKAKHPGL